VAGRRVGVGGVGDDRLSRVGRQLEGVVVEGEVADQRVVERLGAAAVVVHVVGGPAHPELLAAHRQLPDQLGQGPVGRVAARLGAQAAHGGVGDAVPVAVELGRLGVEEDEPGQVDRSDRVTERRRVQGVAELVGGQDVQTSVAQERGRPRHRLQQALHAGTHPLGGGPPASRAGRVGRADQVDEVGALDLIQLQGAGQGFEDLLGDPPGVAAFKARVVLDRDAGQQRHLLPTQPGHPPVPAIDGKAGALGGELGPSGGQELADLPADVVAAGHVLELIGGRRRGGSPCQYP
jgi:hypothetical protein